MGSTIAHVSITQLPNPGLEKEEFEKLGFEFYHKLDKQGTMMYAALPTGWAIYEIFSLGNMKRYVIVDTQGYERANISWTNRKSSETMMSLIKDSQRKFDFNSPEFKTGINKRVYYHHSKWI